MDLRPLDCLDSDELCRFEMLGLTNSAIMPVMITMTPTTFGLQQTQQDIEQQNSAAIAASFRQQQQQQHQHPTMIPSDLLSNKTIVAPLNTSISPLHIALEPKKLSSENYQQYGQQISSSGNAYKNFPSTLHSNHQILNDNEYNVSGGVSNTCELHSRHNTQRRIFSQKFIKSRTPNDITTLQAQQDNITAPCMSKLTLGGTKSDGCGAGCNALMMMKIVSGGVSGSGNGSSSGGGGGGGMGGNGDNNSSNTKETYGNIKMDDTITRQRIHEGIDESNIKQCNCMFMTFDSFTPDYQTSGFGCLPDVTEHSNIRRTISMPDSTSNSEFTDLTSSEKIKKNTKGENKRKYCVFSLSITFTLILFAIVSALIYQFILLKPNRNSYDQRMKIVQKILKEVPLIDGHNDLAWNVRKFAHNSLELIDLSQNFDKKTVWHKPSWSQTDIPRMKEGLLGAQIWSAYVPCEAQGLDAVQLALEQIDIIHRFTELYPSDLVLALSSQEILSAHKKGVLASLIGIEGGHALGSSLGVLRSLHALGARYLTLTHQCDTPWAGSSYMSMDKGLTLFGRAVVKEMNRLGMMIDLSYSSDATARDVLEVTRAPVIFSHSVARSLCNSTRNIPDDILRAIADNGGLIMISFDSQYISCDESSTLDDVIAHIKYIRSIVGIQHIGIGAGFDGITNPPKDLEDVSKYPNLFAALLKDTSWSEEDIGMLAGKNFLRVLKSVENVRDYWKRALILPIETSEPVKKSHCTYMSS